MCTFKILAVATATAVLLVTSTQGFIFLDSSIENAYEHSDQLHKSDDSEKNIDQDLEKNNNDKFLELLQKIAQQPHVNKRSSYKDNDKVMVNKYSRYRYLNSNNNNLPWRPYLYVKPPWLQSVSLPRKFNHPLEERTVTNENINGDIGDFSKVYLLLDPEAKINRPDVKEISEIVSSLLLSSPIKKLTQKEHIEKLRRYKGFVIRDSRRRMRESKEMFATKDSIEHDYKPKRGRGEYGGGGRTSIPYIRQRGDIYERD